MANNSQNLSSFKPLFQNLFEGPFSLIERHFGSELHNQKDKGINLVVSGRINNRGHTKSISNIELRPQCFIIVDMFEYTKTTLSASVMHYGLFKCIFLSEIKSELRKVSQCLDRSKMTKVVNKASTLVFVENQRVYHAYI